MYSIVSLPRPNTVSSPMMTADETSGPRESLQETFAVELVAGRQSPGEQGGKGRSLAKLVQAGFPVPKTGVVTTAAYRSVASEALVRDLIQRVLDGDVVDQSEIDQVFEVVIVESALEHEIIGLAKIVGEGRPIAVRSSATVEDLDESSFAGQYRSLLEVDSTDGEAVLGAVRSVWASLWYAAPTAYREAFGMDQSDVAMAVVLMQMIPATTAGVCLHR